MDDKQYAQYCQQLLEEFSATTLPQDFKPFSAAEVGRARQRVLIDPLKRRADIVAD
jgi:hypothetical protein